MSRGESGTYRTDQISASTCKERPSPSFLRFDILLCSIPSSPSLCEITFGERRAFHAGTANKVTVEMSLLCASEGNPYEAGRTQSRAKNEIRKNPRSRVSELKYNSKLIYFYVYDPRTNELGQFEQNERKKAKTDDITTKNPDLPITAHSPNYINLRIRP